MKTSKINVKEKMYKARYVINTAVITGMLALQQTPFWAASEKEQGKKQGKTNNVDYKWLDDGGGDMFSDVNSTVQEGGQSFFTLMRSVGIIVLVCSIMGIGIIMAVTKNASKKQENKSHLLDIVFAALCIFGVMGLTGILVSVANSL